jgi:putative zinc finger protein
LLSRLQDGRISFGERRKLTLHLLVCEACSRFERQLALVREAMRRYRA